MLCVQGTTDSLVVTTSSAADIDYATSWVDSTTSAFTPDGSHGTISSATTTTMVAAPGASTQRGVKHISICNRHATLAQTVIVKKVVSATAYRLQIATLSPGDCLQYGEAGWQVLDQLGRLKAAPAEPIGYTGRTQTHHKSGTAPDAIGYWYCYAKDGGFPGAWAVGTPGVTGRATDGTAAADAGCIPFQNPATGAAFLTGLNLWSSIAHPFWLLDILWVNSGLVVTTTTAQAVGSVAFPARDVNGSTNGEGLMIGLYVLNATTNAGVNNTATVDYTNSDGTPGRTATLEAVVGMQIPATAVAGTLVWFKLQAGDKGVRSIENITLAASLGAGSISLVVARLIAPVSTTVVGVGAEAQGLGNPGVRLYDGSCLHLAFRASNASATVCGAAITIMER